MSDDPADGRTARRPDGDRRLLVNVAYRLLGSMADAEDAVQETYLRWYALPPAQREQIDSTSAWLVRVCGRICLDLLASARVRRERYVGEWVPEPVPGRQWSSRATGADDAADLVTMDESVSMAFLVVLEELTPAERVAFVLHDVFRYSFAEVADVLGRTPGACRQLASSARRRVGARRDDTVSADTHAHLVKAFKQAWETGDVNALVRLLDPSAVGIVDGGGNVSAPIEPLVGAGAVAEFFRHVVDRQPDLRITEVVANGEPALLAHAGDQTLSVVTMGVDLASIRAVWAVRNPEKLRGWLVHG